jgi:hypothetical protein
MEPSDGGLLIAFRRGSVLTGTNVLRKFLTLPGGPARLRETRAPATAVWEWAFYATRSVRRCACS